MKRLVTLLLTAMMVAGLGLALFPAMPVNAGSTSLSYAFGGLPAMNPIVKPIAKAGGYQITFNYIVSETIPAPCTAPLGCNCAAPNGPGLSITIPNDFPAPSLDPNAPGYITSSAGTVYVYNRTAVVYFGAAAVTVGTIVSFTYGRLGPDNPLIMPSRPNNYTFTMSLRTVCKSNAIVADMPYPASFIPVTLSPVVKVLTNMTPATVTFNPSVEKQNAECEVTFSIGAGEERSLTKGDKIRIWFDIDPATGQTLPVFVLPNEATQVPMSIPAESITVNGMKCTTTPSVQYLADGGGSTALVDVVVPNDIRSSASSGTVVKVKFAKTALIYTGRGTPYQRTVKVATMNASGTNLIEPIPDNYDNRAEALASPPYPNCFLTGNAYRIGTTVTAPSVTVTPPTVSTEAQYTIGLFPCGSAGSLQIGATGALYANDGTITLEFPTGTSIPSFISPGSITISVNGGTPTILSQSPVVNGTRISFKTPVNINNGDCISITFTQSAHIVNPSVGADNYFMKIWTSAEPTIINSGNFSITNPGYAVINVDPNISFTSLLTPPTCAPPPPVYAAPFECYRYANNDCDPTGARYTIQFSLNEACPLNIGSIIYVTFDPDYINIIPNPQIPANLILVNNTICTSPAQLQGDGRTYAIFSPVTLPIKSQVTISFVAGAGIQNPDIIEEKESYSVSIRIPCPPNPDYTITSQPYFLKTEISNIQLVPNWNDDLSGGTWSIYPYIFRPAVNTITGWRFDFCVGDYGDRLTNRPNLVGGDTITIIFPDGTTMPTTAITNGVIRLGIHDENTSGLPIGTPGWPHVFDVSDFGLENVMIDGNKVTMTVPSSVFVNENARLTLFFPESLGIRTPRTAGSYVVMMYTSKETTPVMSSPFTIGTVVTDIGVTVTPGTSQSVDENCVSGYSEMTIRFRNGASGTLVPGNFIYVMFPNGFQHATGMLPIGSVVLNGISNPTPIFCPIGNIGGFPFPIQVQDYIAPGSLIEITFLRDALIKNPRLTQTPTVFTISLFTTSEPAPIKSTPFELISKVCMSCTSSPDFHSVHFWDDATGMFSRTSILMGASGVNNGGWLIGFKTGDVGAIAHDITKVTIEFPARTGVPSYIDPGFIRCSTTAPWSTTCGPAAGTPARSVKVDGTKVTIVFPIDVPAGFNAYIYFCEAASIIAPDIAGETRIKLWTSAEPTPVESCPFLVEPRGMTPAIVTPFPSQAGAPNVQYTVEFYLGLFGSLNAGDMINIDFMQTNAVCLTQIANPQYTGNRIPAMYVTVNDVPCIMPVSYDTPVAGSNPFVLHVQTPVAIPGNGKVKIVFSPQCRITNPTLLSPEPWNSPVAPNYQVRISTNKEVRWTDSEEYEITNPSAPTRPIITNDPCVADMVADYSLRFVTPIPLIFNQTTPSASAYIDIQFPTQFYLPASMAAGMVRVNQFLCVEPPQIINNFTVRVFVPATIREWSTVDVIFSPDLTLLNPNVAGRYHIDLSLNGGPQIAGGFTVCEKISICKVEITPYDTVSVSVGATIQFQAKAYDCQNRLIEKNVTYKWYVNNQEVGYVFPIESQTTTFTAFKKGDAIVQAFATYVGQNAKQSPSTNVIVLGNPSSLVIYPTNPLTVEKGKCFPVSAQLFDDNIPPHPITSNVTYEWGVSDTSRAKIEQTSGRITQICGLSEGSSYILCKAKFEGNEIPATKEFNVSTSELYLESDPYNENGFQIQQPGLTIGRPFNFKLFKIVNGVKTLVNAESTFAINIESSSPTGLFSVDGVNWTPGPKTSVTVTKGFSISSGFFYTDTKPGDVLLTGVAQGINPGLIKITVLGTPVGRLSFLNELRVAAAGAPSPVLTLAVFDENRIQKTVSSNTPIKLTAYPFVNGVVANIPSATGSFSASQTTWVPLQDDTIVMRQGSSMIDFYYKNSVVGKYLITAYSPLYGTDIQEITVIQAGSVGGNLTVTVDKPTALVPSDYHVSFRVGSAGALQSGLSHIFIQLPKGTEIPNYNQADIKVNTSPTNVLPIVDRTTNIIDIVCPVNVNANGDVMVDLPRIINPPAGSYTAKMWTSAESSPATSQLYNITQSSITQGSVNVQVIPNSAGIPGQYTIKFRTGPLGALNKGDFIIVEFPVGTIMPAKIDPSAVVIHGFACTQAPEVTGLQVKVYNTMLVGADVEWDVTFNIQANITNPLVPKNDYRVKVSTKAEPKFMDSNNYEIIQPSTITELKAKLTPQTVSVKANWEISFKLGANGSLVSGDEIFVQMNDETLPTSIAAAYVYVNGQNPAADIVVDGKRLKIKIRGGVSAGQQVTITINANAGIINPDKPGSEYRISVMTTKEPYAVMSDTFTIESSVIVTYSLSPAVPNGKFGWYTVPITISLQSTVSADIQWWYGTQNDYKKVTLNTYSLPFEVDKIGQFTISAIATSKVTGEKSAIKEITQKFDPIAPKILIGNPPDGSQVKDSVINLNGSVTEAESGNVTLTINGESVPMNGSSFSKQLMLKEGENRFNLMAEDAAGNQSSMVYRLILKNKIDFLKIEKPGFYDYVTKVELVDLGSNKKQLNATIDISGFTDVGITQIKVTPVTVPGASQTLPVGPDGKFSGSLKFPAIGGDNEYIVEVTDSLGNVKTERMFIKVRIKFEAVIDNKNAKLNDNPITLLSPPILKKGRTLVPFRILGESFGASVDWDQATRTASYTLGDTRIELVIGSKTAKIIKGSITKPVPLDVPAEIINGSTMVPIRFITENFGAKVTWTQSTKTVTVEFPQ